MIFCQSCHLKHSLRVGERVQCTEKWLNWDITSIWLLMNLWILLISVLDEFILCISLNRFVKDITLISNNTNYGLEEKNYTLFYKNLTTKKWYFIIIENMCKCNDSLLANTITHINCRGRLYYSYLDFL